MRTKFWCHHSGRQYYRHRCVLRLPQRPFEAPIWHRKYRNSLLYVCSRAHFESSEPAHLIEPFKALRSNNPLCFSTRTSSCGTSSNLGPRWFWNRHAEPIPPINKPFRLNNMLYYNILFESSDCKQDNKSSTLTRMAADSSFTVGDYVVFHEDENTICGTHSMTPSEGAMLSIMYFAKFEANKCVFWKVHSHQPA